jgi:pimeloyl-ACP methyl ester carboxylesterase
MSSTTSGPIEALAGTDRTVVFYDQRGSGLADPITDPELLSLDHHVRDLEALRLHLSAQRMTLVGHGAGAPIAAEYAADHPDHVERLVLLHPGSLEDSDLPATVERLTAPALVIDGMRSNASLTSSREWAGMLPNARLLLVPRAGGDVLAEQPARVTTALKQFLAGRHPTGSEVVPGPDAH